MALIKTLFANNFFLVPTFVFSNFFTEEREMALIKTLFANKREGGGGGGSVIQTLFANNSCAERHNVAHIFKSTLYSACKANILKH